MSSTKDNGGGGSSSSSSSSRRWIVSSPASSQDSNNHTSSSIVDRILRWLRMCWNRISKFSFLVTRTSEVVLRLSPLVILAPAAYLSNRGLSSSSSTTTSTISTTTNNHHNVVSNVAWKYAIWAAQGLGPVAVKFCQWAATRRDIFPPSMCDRLSILHDRGHHPSHSLRWTRKVLAEAFGDYEQKGLVLEDVIGCGAAAQVYRGKLTTVVENTTTTTTITPPPTSNSEHKKSPSTSPVAVTVTRDVAIKVLHPRVRETVDRDLEFIEIVAGALHSLPIRLLRMLNLPRAVEEFSVLLRDQVDLVTEAENLRRFHTNFHGNQNHSNHINHNGDDSSNNNNNNHNTKETSSSIVFPQPIHDDWISSRVIVEDYVSDAVPIADFLLDSSPEGMDRRKDLAAPLLRAFLKMVFVDNFIHGDLHPGNVLVQTTMVQQPSSPWSIFSNNNEPTEKENTRVKRSIVFLDAGMVVSLSPSDKKNLFDLFRAVVFNDGNRAGRLMVERNNNNNTNNNKNNSAVQVGSRGAANAESEASIDQFSEGIEDIVSEFHKSRKEGLTLGTIRIGDLLRRVLDLCRVHGVEIDPSMASVVISTLVLEGLGRSLSPDLDLLTFARPFLWRSSV